MSTFFPPSNPTFAPFFPQTQALSAPCCPPRFTPCSRSPLDTTTSQISDYGFKRFVPLLESPPVGGSILALTFFFFIAFLSDLILANITSITLGIVVTISTFGILALILLILILL